MTKELITVAMEVPQEILVPRLAEALRSMNVSDFSFMTGGLLFTAEKADADQIRAHLRTVGATGGEFHEGHLERAS